MTGAEHQHRQVSRGPLRAALVVTGLCLVGEFVVGIVAHSVALLADAGHMLTDAGALIGSLWAMRLAAQPVSARWSFGLKRAEIVAAATNGVALAVIAAVIVSGAVSRLLHPVAVNAVAVLVLALVGALATGAATLILSRTRHESLNVESVFQHAFTDAAGFLATATAAVVILATGFRRADPIASLAIVALMLRSAWSLLRASGRILMEATPEGVDLQEVRAHLLAADEHVADVHDLHAWMVTSALPAVSAHVVVDDSCFSDGHAPQILDALQDALIGQFDVEHSTLQLEAPSHAAHELGAH